MINIGIYPITAEQARSVRRPILRPGYSAEYTIFPGDDWPDTLHAGAFENGQLVGVATLIHQPPPESNDPGLWRLRGMATLPAVRGKGYGGSLVKACLAYAADHNGVLVWCDARESAVVFYRKLGFEVRGDRYNIPESGPHYRMWYKFAS